MTIPVAQNYPEGAGVRPPNNPYALDNIPNEAVELLPNERNEQDPRVLLSAQLRNNLYIADGAAFETNVPEAVYNDFTARGNQWKEYVEQGGWNNLDHAHRMIGKMVANSIKQEYFLLGSVGQEPKCMFGLEKIALHIRDVVSMETFFTSLFQ